MKTGPKMPADLDVEAKKKWRQLVGSCDPDVDGELLGLYCRQHGILVGIRREREMLQREGKFQMMVRGRDGTEVLHPLLVTERRLVNALSRQLKQLGFTPAQEHSRFSKKEPDPDHIDLLEALLMGPFGVQETRIWREIRRGKVKDPSTRAERAELESDRLEADRRLEQWKVSHGILDDGWVRLIKAPGIDATPEENQAYHAANLERDKRLETALARAGLNKMILHSLE
jgi:phage terminase small subunit